MAVDRVRNVVQEEWAYLRGLLPANLDELATESGALRRRRIVASGHDLLRLALAYAVEDWSLRQTAAMAQTLEWHVMSDVAILKRLRACPEFLRRVIAGVLERRLEFFPHSSLRIALVDASTVSRPGSDGADWRLHLTYDLSKRRIERAELTDRSQGETLSRLEVEPDVVYVADQAYGTAPGLLHLLEQGGSFVARTSLQRIRLDTPEGGQFDSLRWLEGLPDAAATECQVILRSDERSWPLRLVALRKSPEAVEKAVQRVQRESRRKGRTPRPETLFLAHYVVVLTNCEAAVTPEQILEVYRLRWQIELVFKRLKSLLHLDHLRARDPDLAQTYLLAKILAALLAEELLDRAAAFSPWAYQLVPTAA
jgi:Transposase DDE domain